MRRTTTLGALAAGLALDRRGTGERAPPKHGVEVERIAGGPRQPAPRRGREGRRRVGRRVGHRRARDVEVVLRQRRGRRLHGRDRRDHAHRPVGPEARRDRASRRSRRPSGNSAIGPHGIFADGNDVYFTNGGPTGPTRGGPTEHRPARPDAGRPRSRSRAFYGTLRKVDASRRATSRSPTSWQFENENNPDAAVGNPLDRLQPGRRLRRPRALLRRRRGRQQRAARRALRRHLAGGDLPRTANRRRPRSAGRTRSRCRRCRPAWSRARTARST